jgi:hypothetical protein
MKFGKLPPKPNPKGLRLAKYLTAGLAAPPERVWREYKIQPGHWTMMGNDTIGDCTCAAIGHFVMLATAHTGELVTPSKEDVLAVYSAVTGYDPATGANDNGAVITAILEYWRTTGIAGHKILAWASINPANIIEVKQGIQLFGGVDIGVQLPVSAMQQFNSGIPWQIKTPDGGLDGGHSVPMFGYGGFGANCITWGQRQGMAWTWFTRYCDEAYVVITPDWFNKATSLTPSGFDLATLEADLKALAA